MKLDRRCRMLQFHQPVFSKFITIVLAVLLFFGDFNLYPRGDSGADFAAACEYFRSKDYRDAVPILQSLIEPGSGTGVELRAKALLLLVVCCDNLGDNKGSQEYSRQLRRMLDDKLIPEIPGIPGINPEVLAPYREALGDRDFFQHKEPLEVSRVMKENVIHAPRKSAAEKKKEKKKKKFPWLLAVGAVVVVGTAAVLLFTGKKGGEPEFPEIEWVRIPAGGFLMGDNFNEGDADELPVHSVYLDEYYISKYEITIEQYNFYCRKVGREEHRYVNSGYNPGSGIFTPSRISNCPVYDVSHDEAMRFCGWLSAETGQSISLPTEAQWEKAARGSGQKRYPWGNREPDCETVNFLGCPVQYSQPVYPVDSYAGGVSPYGAYSMAGNVREWCRDWYDPCYYSVSPHKNPQGPAAGIYHVVRGGSGITPAGEIRSANRCEGNPAIFDNDIGFRVVKEVGNNRK